MVMIPGDEEERTNQRGERGFRKGNSKGGFKREADSWSFEHTNKDLLNMAKTTPFEEFVRCQQRSYVANVIRMDNKSTSKRLLFNNNQSQKPGPQVTLLAAVAKNNETTPGDITGNILRNSEGIGKSIPSITPRGSIRFWNQLGDRLGD